MTESEWLDRANPHTMLEHLKRQTGSKRSLLSSLGIQRVRPNSRKVLLFTVACCRRIESLLVDQRSCYALDIAERPADGRVGRRERNLAAVAANAAAFDASSPRIGVGGWLASAHARATEAVAAGLADQDPANVAAARTKEAVRARAKAIPISSVETPGLIPSVEVSWNSAVFVAASSARSATGHESRTLALELDFVGGSPAFVPGERQGLSSWEMYPFLSELNPAFCLQSAARSTIIVPTNPPIWSGTSRSQTSATCGGVIPHVPLLSLAED
jgi:hypothetical protein